MNKWLLYGIGMASASAPSIALAHTQFFSHHHNGSEYWLSFVPEIVLAGLSLVAITILVTRIKRARKQIKD